MSRLATNLIWIAIGTAGAAALTVLALQRGETINAAWLITAAVCTYVVAYRFYSKIIAAKVFALDADAARRRPSGSTTAATTCRRTDGSCSATTSRRSPVPGRSSARRSPRSSATCPACSGSSSASPSAAPCRTSSSSASSVRRNGKSLGQMAKEEIGPIAGLHGAGRGARHHDRADRGAGARRRERAQARARGASSRSGSRFRSRC